MQKLKSGKELVRIPWYNQDVRLYYEPIDLSCQYFNVYRAWVYMLKTKRKGILIYTSISALLVLKVVLQKEQL